MEPGIIAMFCQILALGCPEPGVMILNPGAWWLQSVSEQVSANEDLMTSVLSHHSLHDIGWSLR
jgi:hypothetical protein